MENGIASEKHQKQNIKHKSQKYKQNTVNFALSINKIKFNFDC